MSVGIGICEQMCHCVHACVRACVCGKRRESEREYVCGTIVSERWATETLARVLPLFMPVCLTPMIKSSIESSVQSSAVEPLSFRVEAKTRSDILLLELLFSDILALG